MSFYITLISDQAQGTGQKFTARLPRSYYLVEDDWEAALVHISHPGFNQQCGDQTKQNWTQEDSQKHWMKTDVRYIPKRAEGTAPIQVTKQIHLPPGYYTHPRSCQQIPTVWHCVRQFYPPRFQLLFVLGSESQSTTISQYANGQTPTRATTIDDLHGSGVPEHCGKSRERIFTYLGCRQYRSSI